jgi:hypothetical protein
MWANVQKNINLKSHILTFYNTVFCNWIVTSWMTMALPMMLLTLDGSRVIFRSKMMTVVVPLGTIKQNLIAFYNLYFLQLTWVVWPWKNGLNPLLKHYQQYGTKHNNRLLMWSPILIYSEICLMLSLVNVISRLMWSHYTHPIY